MKTEPTELEKLRAEEARLEELLAGEKVERDLRIRNITKLVYQISECKKAIGALTIGKIATI
jgi:hypothetical protein